MTDTDPENIVKVRFDPANLSREELESYLHESLHMTPHAWVQTDE